MLRKRVAVLLASCAVSFSAAFFWSAGPLLAAQGDTRTSIFAGSASLRAGDDTTTGTSFGGGWGVEIQDHLLWSISASHTTTTGERVVNGRTVPLSADSTNLLTGLTHFFNADSTFVPFTGGGFSLAAYDIDFAYQNSEIGKTSGTGGGVFGRLGVELRLSRNFTFIPQFNFSIHSIRTDQGGTDSLISDGLLLSFRIST